jgi:hypothetical protein
VFHDGYVSVYTIDHGSEDLQETYLPALGAGWATQDLTKMTGLPTTSVTPGAVYHSGYTTPRLVLPGKPQHHRPDLPVRCRAPGPTLARPARPPAADDVPVPPQDGTRGNDQPHRGARSGHVKHE